MSFGYWNDDVGCSFDGLAITVSDAPVGNTSVTGISSKIHHNLYYGNCDGFRIDCMVIETFNDKR